MLHYYYSIIITIGARIMAVQLVFYVIIELVKGAVMEEKTGLKGKDGAQYVRQQKGHSAILHWVILGVFTLWILPIYYTISKNHYWHA